jgi:glycosyltransferase involved in cell wall biosynthesis
MNIPQEMNKTLRVLVVDLSMKYGGSTSRILSLMAMADPGTVGLAALKTSAISREAQQMNIPLHIVGRNKTDLRIPRRIADLIRQETYQVVDTQNIQSKFWASMAIGRTNAALVSTINSWYTNEHGGTSLKGKIYTMLELSTNSNLNLYITVSKNDQLALLRSNIASEKIELIYNAVNTVTQKIIKDSVELRNRYSIPASAIVCTSVGRLVPIKGFDVLIKAAQNLLEAQKNVYFLIVGDGESRKELEGYIKSAGLESRILLTGHQERDAVLSIVKSSDIFIMPSRYEGTPIALLEAGSLGIPIVATKVGGIPELVENQIHALLVPRDDPLALAGAVEKLITDKDLASSLANNALMRIQHHFNLETQFKNTWNAYRKALAFRQQKNIQPFLPLGVL